MGFADKFRSTSDGSPTFGENLQKGDYVLAAKQLLEPIEERLKISKSDEEKQALMETKAMFDEFINEFKR